MTAVEFGLWRLLHGVCLVQVAQAVAPWWAAGWAEQQPPLEQISQWLKLPMQDIPYLKVLLRRHSLQQDAELAYTRWFLRQRRSKIGVHSYDLAVGDDLGNASCAHNHNRNNYAIVANLSTLRPVMQHFAQRAGNFFFILSDDRVTPMQLKPICGEMWLSLKIYKSYMLTTTGVWVYDPFEYVVPQRSYGSVVSYDGHISLERLLFRDMRGYPLRLQIFRSVYARPTIDEETHLITGVEGVDGMVADMLQQRMNFTMLLQEPDPNYFGERDDQGQYNGAIGSIIKDGVDLCLTGFFIKDYKVDEYMDFTVAVYDDKLCIYVPKAQRIPQSIVPIFAVRCDIWLGFILTAFVSASAWLLLRACNLRLGIVDFRRGYSLWWQALRIFNDTWVVWVRSNIVRFPRSYSERILVGTLCLVSVIFGAVFESSLATVFIHPLYYKDINSLQELDDSGLQVVYKYTSMADDLFFSETSKLFANLNKKLFWVKDLNADIMYEVSEYGGKASVTRLTVLRLEASPFTLSNRIWVVPECPKYYTLSYVMPKDSPWGQAVNTLLLNLLNAGIMNKWISDMQVKSDIETRTKVLANSNLEGFRMLNIGDLQLAFYVVLCGYLLALLTYAIECLSMRHRFKVNTE